MTERDVWQENERLRQQLAETEQALQAFRTGQVDAVATEAGSPVLLQQAQEALRKSEHRLRAIFDGSLDAMALTTADGRFVDVNAAGCALLGRPAVDVIEHSVSEFVADGDVYAEVRSTLSRDGRAGGELQLVHSDRTHRSVEFLTIANIEPGLHFSVFRDITARKEVEVILRETAASLRQAKKMEAIGLLAGGIAHDFNNLLSVIIGYASFLIDEADPTDPRRADLEAIYQAGRRGADMTHKLLAFSRKQVLQPRPIDLHAVVTGMSTMLRQLVTENVRVSIVGQSELHAVLADPGEIEQMILNLVVNARDAMPNGGSLTIETANVELTADDFMGHPESPPPGAFAMLAVTDTGTGMTAETQGRIFEPFFTTKDPGKGTGLGLATVFGIVKQSSGHLVVRSEVGKGTTFRIYLPRTALAPVVVEPPVRSANRRGSETILVVEDEMHVRQLVRSILERNGYHVLEAENAGEALMISEQFTRPIHVLLTDVVMPRVDGPQLAQRIASRHKEARIVFMSGYAAGLIGELDGDGFLRKPIAPDTLLDKIRSVLDTPRTRTVSERRREVRESSFRVRPRVLLIDDEPLLLVGFSRALKAEFEPVSVSSARDALEHVVSGRRFDLILCDLTMPDMSGIEFFAELTRIAPAQTPRVVFLSGGATTRAVQEFLDSVSNRMLTKPISSAKLVSFARSVTTDLDREDPVHVNC